MAKALINLLNEQFPGVILGSHAQHGDETVVVAAGQWRAVLAFLRDAPRASMNMLTDLTVVDYPDREPRFEVVVHLCSLSRGHRLRVKASVGGPDGRGAEIASVSELWGAANWLEREAWDMFGVRFVGHPDLRRILLYPEFEGHPLRKDYPAERIQPLVEYRDAPNLQKVAPFDAQEGMSFGRQVHGGASADGAEDRELFPDA